MRRGWSIEKHRVELEVNAAVLTVRVDGASPPALAQRSNLLGSWPIQVGERVAILRRVRSLDVARNELWVDGVKVPPSPEPIRFTLAKADTRCKVHPSNETSGATPEAGVECGECRAPTCAECLAVDGLRCRECFARAVEELNKQDRANRIKGPAIAAALIVALAIVGFATHSLPFLECAGGAAVLFVFLVVQGLIQERREARTLAKPTTRGASLASRTRS